MINSMYDNLSMRVALTFRGTLCLDTTQAILEFDLGGLQLCERGGQVFDLLVQLLLDGCELLGVQAVEAHCGGIC